MRYLACYHEHLTEYVVALLAARERLFSRRFFEAKNASTEWVIRQQNPDGSVLWTLAKIDPNWRDHLTSEDIEWGKCLATRLADEQRPKDRTNQT